VRGDKFDLNCRDIHGPTTTFQGCTSVTDTRTPAVVCDLMEHDQPNHKGNSCKQLKNKINNNSICIHKIWGLESSRTGGLADTRVYREVAAAKHTIKQNLSVPNDGS
jgi:hypothetical protein